MSLIPLNGYSNKYFSALNQRYGSSILSLGPFQQNAVKDIVRLSYQAGVEDARRAIRNKQKKIKRNMLMTKMMMINLDETFDKIMRMEWIFDISILDIYL